MSHCPTIPDPDKSIPSSADDKSTGGICIILTTGEKIEYSNALDLFTQLFKHETL